MTQAIATNQTCWGMPCAPNPEDATPQKLYSWGLRRGGAITVGRAFEVGAGPEICRQGGSWNAAGHYACARMLLYFLLLVWDVRARASVESLLNHCHSALSP
jgi:hypothetical protein